jgi:AraC-like DNA-binding protein
MASDSTTTPVLLGEVAGVYCERVPPEPLRHHFSCTWLNKISPEGDKKATIAPDGCIDLQWIGGMLRIAGPDREANIECLPAGATVIGLRFQPGAATEWLDAPASEILDERLPLETVWGARARQIADWVAEGQTPERLARRLEAAMLQAAEGVKPPQELPRLIFRMLNEARQPGTDAVGWLRDRSGLSERTLRRKCHDAFGYGPKTLDRILRFQRFLHTARTAGSNPLAGLAGEAGYSDQAHLSRECRRMTGLTPSEILKQFTAMADSFKTSA